MLIGALDVVRQLVDDHCPNLHCDDVIPSGMSKDEDLEFLVLGREDSVWVQWVIVYYDQHYILCKDEGFKNPHSSIGVRRVDSIFGVQVDPIFIHEKDAANRLTNLLKKLNAITQYIP